ncbi:MAG: 3-phosphoshikimate 1-carboxyvinyltransferase [Syntrophobacterales bacterium]|nr:3-phosphoshikimate 1-carboxyvinyltransferase [Syntrophobacterales bacterium]
MVKEIKPVDGKVYGSIKLPGSKSMTHRAMLMGALSDRPVTIVNPLQSEDTLYTAKALEKLGCELKWEIEEGRLELSPLRHKSLGKDRTIDFFVGNSGTTMRLLIGFLGAIEGRFVLDGSGRMRERPVGPVVESLSQLGVDCKFLKHEGYPPVEITSCGLEGGTVIVDARKSSQFLSAVLIASPQAKRDVVIRWLDPVASYPYVSMTIRMMEERGIRVERSSSCELLVKAPQVYKGGTWIVEGDCSSASYFWATAALTGGLVRTEPVFRKSYQGDSGLLEILSSMGCTVRRGDTWVEVRGPDRLHSVEVDMNDMPDMVPTLAVLGAFATGKTVIKRVGHLRIKESDRLRAVASELSRLGTVVEEGEDFLIIHGETASRGAEIETYDDHRIAMAFSLAGLKIPGVRIKNPDVVRKSFPNYWQVWEQFVYGLS